MYADDTTNGFAGKNFNNLDFELNEDLINVNEWLIGNKLILNVTKTEFMIIRSSHRRQTHDNNEIEIKLDITQWLNRYVMRNPLASI